MAEIRVFKYRYADQTWAPFWIARCKRHGVIRDDRGKSGRPSWNAAYHSALVHHLMLHIFSSDEPR